MVVVGGGPAGATVARCLARTGHRVLLADFGDRAAFKIGEGLPPSARPLLRDLELWERFADEGHLPCYGTISVWGSPRPQSTDFVFDPNGHGWHLDRPRCDRFLRTVAAEEGVAVREGTRVRPLVRDEGEWRLEISSGPDLASVRCAWLVDATGRRSAIARHHGARRRVTDALISVHARFRAAGDAAAQDRDTRTLIEAVPGGWWYTALVPGGQRVVAYLTDADLLGPAAHRPAGFLDLLTGTRHIRACLARYGYLLDTAPRGASARSVQLDTTFGDGWLAVGDAALSCDPLSSQGIVTALYTGMAGGHALHAHLSGDVTGPDRYQARIRTIGTRYRHNHAAFYRLEQRWPQHPFWHRRIGSGAP